MTAAVVANGRADVGGDRIQLFQYLLDRSALKRRGLFKRGIQLGNVRGVVFPVVDLHGLRIDVRLQGIECVGKVWQTERHYVPPNQILVKY